MLENLRLKEELSAMQSRLEYLQISTVDQEVVLRLEAKIGDLETRLDLEQATRQRAEVKKIQIIRLNCWLDVFILIWCFQLYDFFFMSFWSKTWAISVVPNVLFLQLLKLWIGVIYLSDNYLNGVRNKFLLVFVINEWFYCSVCLFKYLIVIVTLWFLSG